VARLRDLTLALAAHFEQAQHEAGDEEWRPSQRAPGRPREVVMTVAERDRRCDERARARCRRMGVRYVEAVLLSVVFARDRGVCWLCGGTALLDPPAGAITHGVTGIPRPVPHPELATLDHVLPLSELGEHSYANVRLAHLVCNAVPARQTPEFYRRKMRMVRESWQANAARQAATPASPP
jgi:hypothetical protein